MRHCQGHWQGFGGPSALQLVHLVQAHVMMNGRAGGRCGTMSCVLTSLNMPTRAPALTSLLFKGCCSCGSKPLLLPVLVNSALAVPNERLINSWHTATPYQGIFSTCKHVHA